MGPLEMVASRCSGANVVLAKSEDARIWLGLLIIVFD